MAIALTAALASTGLLKDKPMLIFARIANRENIGRCLQTSQCSVLAGVRAQRVLVQVLLQSLTDPQTTKKT
jgi:hypothetical protein